MITALGATARAYAHGLGDIEAIVTDPASIAQAVLAAVGRRERGEPFYAMVLFEDKRLGITYRAAGQVCVQTTDPDMRSVVLNQLSSGDLLVDQGKPIRGMWAETTDVTGPAYEFYALADAILVRSYTEYAWIARLFERRPAPPVVCVAPERPVPAVRRRQPERLGVVIWAPERDAGFVGLHAAALADLHGEVTCVVGSGTLPPTIPATVMTPGDPRVDEVLARATCVVCAEPNDPADAVAFASLGYGVVAPVTAGAHEFADGVQLWNGHFPYHLYTAVVTALGRPAAFRERPAPPPPLRAPVVADAPDLPTVSVVIPTFNRPDLLTNVLAAVGRQTYPHVETIVVNDGGVAVDDVVARFPFARLIAKAENAGALRAIETGLHNSTGAYVMFLPDDDTIYPDHVSRLMAALLRSGAAVAHASALLRYLGRTETGADVLRGFNARVFSQTLTRSEGLVASPVSVNQCLQHRRIFDEIGWFLNDSAVADNEFHMRLVQRYTPIFVPNVTCEFRDHQRGSLGKSLDLGAALKAVYEEQHPFPGRAFLGEMRRQALENVARRVPGESPFAPTFVISQTPPA